MTSNRKVQNILAKICEICTKTSRRIWHPHLFPQTLNIIEHIFFSLEVIIQISEAVAIGFLMRTTWSREVGQAPEQGTYLSGNCRGGGSEEIRRYQFHSLLPSLGVMQSRGRPGKVNWWRAQSSCVRDLVFKGWFGNHTVSFARECAGNAEFEAKPQPSEWESES